MNADDLLNAEVLDAVRGLDPDAVPFVAALLSSNCLVVPSAIEAPLLALLRSVATQPYSDGPEWQYTPEQLSIVSVWHSAQTRTPGAEVIVSPAWGLLRYRGCEQAAHAAVCFAVRVASAVLSHTVGEPEPTIH